jgi:hypothetical protein
MERNLIRIIHRLRHGASRSDNRATAENAGCGGRDCRGHSGWFFRIRLGYNQRITAVGVAGVILPFILGALWAGSSGFNMPHALFRDCGLCRHLR